MYEQLKTFKENQESNIQERQYPTEMSQPREISKAERRNRTAVKKEEGNSDGHPNRTRFI